MKVTTRAAEKLAASTNTLDRIVNKHNTPQSCWVVLYGKVYDVSQFLPSHPGGSQIILKLAGADATEQYDPIHPPGTLEDNLPSTALLGTVDPSTLPKPAPVAAQTTSEVELPTLSDCLNLDEIEALADKKVNRKAWAYYYSAGDDLISKSYNNEVYKKVLLRPRIFIDCTSCSTATTFLGHMVNVPIMVSPAAMARLGHPEGEHGIAQACASYGAMQIISNNASMTPEQIVDGAKPDQVFGWQLYVQNERVKSEKMLQRIHALPNIKFICLTLDAPVPGKREDDEREGKNVGAPKQKPSSTQPEPSLVDAEGIGGDISGGIGKAMFAGTAPDLTWRTTLPWLAKHTHLPIVLKGIQTHEDAYLASLYAPQIKGIILSNHGGRALDTAPPALHTLMEIRKYVPEVFNRIEVWVDGGIKRGTDVVKALCLGARGVGIGRAALWGLGAGGKEGVARVFESESPKSRKG
jgi:L-lactate dehydrogenase (cytochrome)